MFWCSTYFQLLYLRRFKKLQTLNLSGNPIAQMDEYKDYTIAYLPAIEFLDYRLVDENSVKTSYLIQKVWKAC